MSYDVPHDPDCSYCFRGAPHDLAHHEASIALTQRLERLCPLSKSPAWGAEYRRLRRRVDLENLERKLTALNDLIASLERKAHRSLPLPVLRGQQEILSTQIALLRTELEVEK